MGTDDRPVTRRVRIATFGGPDVIDVSTTTVPEPGPGQVRVRVLASTVSSTDAVIRKGVYPLLREKPPLTLGYDLVGVVEAHGPGVRAPAVGAGVAALVQTGGNADHVCLDGAQLLPVPAALDPVEVAPLVLGYLTAYQMLTHHARVRAGERILVHGGAGATGTALLQLARDRGVAAVATARTANLDHVRDQGAEPVDHTAAGAAETLRRLALESPGGGFAAVFDPLGPASVRESSRLLTSGGTVVAYSTLRAASRIERRTTAGFAGFAATYASLRLTLAVLDRSPERRRARFFGIVDSARDHPERLRADLATLVALLTDGRIAPVTTVLPLDQARAAHALLDAGGHRGAIVLTTRADL